MVPTPAEAECLPLSDDPFIEILECISFQKFRYNTEGRPGIKSSEKEFMTLRMNNLADKVVRVIIVCTDAENNEIFHPNCVVGTDCHDGIYDKEYPVLENSFRIKVPYLRIERIKINYGKSAHEKPSETNNIQAELLKRAHHLPSPYQENCRQQCLGEGYPFKKLDTNKVCLRVIVTVQTSLNKHTVPYYADSHMVLNKSGKTHLSIHKLSKTSISAGHGGLVDIFTNEGGPSIEPEKCFIHITLGSPGAEYWQSEIFTPKQEDILYKRVISYAIPPVAEFYDISSPTTATLHLTIPQSSLYCRTDFVYLPLKNSTDYVAVHTSTLKSNKRSVEKDDTDVEPVVKKLKHKLQKKHQRIRQGYPKTDGESSVLYTNGNIKVHPGTHDAPQNCAIGVAAQIQVIQNSAGPIKVTQEDLKDKTNERRVSGQQAVCYEAVNPVIYQQSGLQAVGEELVNNSSSLSESHNLQARAKSSSVWAQNTNNTSSPILLHEPATMQPVGTKLNDSSASISKLNYSYAKARSFSPFAQNSAYTKSSLCDISTSTKQNLEPSPWEVGGFVADEAFVFAVYSEDHSPVLAKKRIAVSSSPSDTQLTSTDSILNHEGLLLQSIKSDVGVTTSAPSQEKEPNQYTLQTANAGMPYTIETVLEGALPVINLPTFEVSQFADNLNGGLMSLSALLT